MRIHVLTPIEGYGTLASLFNDYMRGLAGLQFVAVPRQTVAQMTALVAQDAAAGTQHAAEQALPFYSLQVLDNALTDLHRCVQLAGLELCDFFKIYRGNFFDFAVGQRQELLEIHGSDDDGDWNEDGSIRHRVDAAGLLPFTLRAALAPYFTGPAARGEAIGSSQPADFSFFHKIVGNASAFSPISLLAAVTSEPLPLYQRSESGGMVSETLGDQLERQLNEDLQGEAVVQRFNAVLHLGQTAAALYATLGPEDAAGYQRLYNLVKQMDA
ncbi:hypothetical protein [Hymenobacter sp. PAMC 26628]|uniref:hypothetical protein n=1 Tax=Hymenobacter sp. PAMC 26628 TaxID=1484118 RepID=UPI0007706B91|nr:hypothetical protein [Hymenobacter sp. PAMC 26628]AMJ67196.1 hypothetical protein AXW84_18495 [Hymenobacter sp. PAMC 26628]